MYGRDGVCVQGPHNMLRLSLTSGLVVGQAVCQDCGNQEHGEARCPHRQWQSEAGHKQEPGQSLL